MKLSECTINELLNLLDIAIHDDDHDFEVAVNEALAAKGYFDFGPVVYDTDFIEEDDEDFDEEPIDLEVGFDPYEGDYTWDC